MINKNIKKILDDKKVKLLGDLNLNSRPSELKRKILQITNELFEKFNNFFLFDEIIFSICFITISQISLMII